MKSCSKKCTLLISEHQKLDINKLFLLQKERKNQYHTLNKP